MSALPLFASTVYFIRIGKFIKIGVTTDLEQDSLPFEVHQPSQWRFY